MKNDVAPGVENDQLKSGSTDHLVWCLLGCRLILASTMTSFKFLVLGRSESVPGAFERLGFVSMSKDFAKGWIRDVETKTMIPV